LHGPHHRREDAECLHPSQPRFVRLQAGGDVVDDDHQAVGECRFRALGAAPDLVEERGGRASFGGVGPMLGGQVLADELLESRAVGGKCAESYCLPA
jgi:hypothetical protein